MLPQASAPAVRGEQVRIRPLPSRPTCHRVAVIGDSLMDNARWYLSSALGQAGYSFVIDAQPSRRIPESVRVPYSGVIAARQVRSTWGDADCWVIALGSNDLIYGGGVTGHCGVADRVDARERHSRLEHLVGEPRLSP